MRRRLYAIAESGWKLVRGPLVGVFGEKRVGRALDAFGLRSFKTRHFVLETAVADGCRLSYRPQDQCIIEEIYKDNVYGAPTLFKPGNTVIDAGGHIGTFAVFAAKRVGPTGRVVVCEPAPDNLQLLRDNLSRNGLSWAHAHGCAVGDKAGEADLFVSESAADNPAANTLFPTSGRRAIRVKLRTLDEIAGEENLRVVDHLKIDIEGAELQALRGATHVLAMTKRLVMEVHPDHVQPQDVLDLLTANGFEPKVLSRREHSWMVEALRNAR